MQENFLRVGKNKTLHHIRNGRTLCNQREGRQVRVFEVDDKFCGLCESVVQSLGVRAEKIAQDGVDEAQTFLRAGQPHLALEVLADTDKELQQKGLAEVWTNAQY